MSRTARKGAGARVEWDLANGEGKWVLDLRYYRMLSREQFSLGEMLPELAGASRLRRSTTASRFCGAATLAAAKEIPYANASERWQNDLRARKGQKHAYSSYCVWYDDQRKHKPAPEGLSTEEDGFLARM